MKLKTFRLPMASTAVAALTFGLITLPGAVDALAAPVTETKSIVQECVEHRGTWSDGSFLTLSPDNIVVEYPQQVYPGDTFTVKLQPGEMTTGEKDTGRMKYDFKLPEGVDISNLRISAAGTGFNNEPVVQRVNATGNVDDNGEFARIWDGGNSVNNGGNENDNWFVATPPRAGLQVNKHKTWRFPQIAFDITAPDTAGSTIVTGLRAAGTGAGPASRENRDNTMSMLARANVTDAVYCTATAEGATLTSTQVMAPADTTLTAVAPTGVKPMVEAPTTVTVAPAVAGTVTATVEGQAISAEVDPATGNATLPLVFPREGRYSVPVEFTPANPRAAAPSSTTIDVTVAAPTYDSVTIALVNEPEGKTGEKHLFRADITPNIGNASNVTGFLTLKVNGDKLMKDGAEVRFPVTRGVSNFDLTWQKPGEKTIEATFIGTEGQAMGSTTTTVTIVDENGEVPPGDDGEDEPPTVGGDLPSDPGSSGSSDITSFFERLWQFIVDLFTGQLPGSAGSSDRPATGDAVPATTN